MNIAHTQAMGFRLWQSPYKLQAPQHEANQLRLAIIRLLVPACYMNTRARLRTWHHAVCWRYRRWGCWQVFNATSHEVLHHTAVLMWQCSYNTQQHTAKLNGYVCNVQGDKQAQRVGELPEGRLAMLLQQAAADKQAQAL